MESRVSPLLRPYLSLCIIVPFSNNYTKSSLMEMVKDINETQVASEEVLSNRVYTYIREKEEVSI